MTSILFFADKVQAFFQRWLEFSVCIPRFHFPSNEEKTAMWHENFQKFLALAIMLFAGIICTSYNAVSGQEGSSDTQGSLASVSYPPLQWIGQNLTQVPLDAFNRSNMWVDDDGEILLLGRSSWASKFAFYSPGSGWSAPAIPAGRRPIVIVKEDSGAAIHTDDGGSTPMRMWSLPDGGQMTELFVGNPNAGGGPHNPSINDNGVIAFLNAADNHSGTPKDYYRWTPSGGLESLPRVPNNTTYYGDAVPRVDPQGRVLVTMPDGIWRYDAQWQKIASLPSEGFLSNGQLMCFASNGDIVLPVQVRGAGNIRTWRWLSYNETSGVYTTIYDVPVMQSNLDVNLLGAKVAGDGTLTFFAYNYYYSLQAEAMIQVSPNGTATILENAVPGGLAIDMNRFCLNESGNVLARVKDNSTGVYDFRLWKDGVWTGVLSPELSNLVSSSGSFAMDNAGKIYFSLPDGSGGFNVGMVVPEPSTVCLLSVAGFMLILMVRKGRSRKHS